MLPMPETLKELLTSPVFEPKGVSTGVRVGANDGGFVRKLVFAVLRAQGVGRRVLALAAEAEPSQLQVLLLSAFEPSLAVELTRPTDPRVDDSAGAAGVISGTESNQGLQGPKPGFATIGTRRGADTGEDEDEDSTKFKDLDAKAAEDAIGMLRGDGERGRDADDGMSAGTALDAVPPGAPCGPKTDARVRVLLRVRPMSSEEIASGNTRVLIVGAGPSSHGSHPVASRESAQPSPFDRNTSS